MELHLIALTDHPNEQQKWNRAILMEDHQKRLDENLTPFQKKVQHYPSRHFFIEVQGRTFKIEQPALELAQT